MKEYYWKTKEGVRVRPCDMDDGHLLNTIKLLQRFQKEERDGWCLLLAILLTHKMTDETVRTLASLKKTMPEKEQPNIFNVLTAEAVRRGLIKQPAPVEATQATRCGRTILIE